MLQIVIKKQHAFREVYERGHKVYQIAIWVVTALEYASFGIFGYAMKVNCLIIEDNPIDRETVLGFAKKVPCLNIVAVCSSAMEANTYLANGGVTLILSDIAMEEFSGLDFIRSLPNPPFVIFITSFPDYAVQGFQVDAVDYLVKPITFDRFLKAVNKAVARIQGENVTTQEVTEIKSDHFFIRVDGQYIKLKYDDVVYIEAHGDFIKINTVIGQHLVLVNLKNLEGQLPASLFMRVHRSYIVNLSHIDRIDNTDVVARQFTIPLGSIYREKVYASVVEKKLVKRFPDGSQETS